MLGIEEIQANIFAKVEAIFADQSRREEMQWKLIPQHQAHLLHHRDVLTVQNFKSGPLKALGTKDGADPEITSRISEIVMEAVAAMVEAGEMPAFYPTSVARVAAGLPLV